MSAHRRLELGAGVVLLLLLATPWARHGMEATMWRHMLMQFPCWLIVGGLLAASPSARSRAAIGAWNAYGVAGFTAASVILGTLMVPRVLDLALYRPEIEVAKLLALLLAGAALRLSWRPAGVIVQSFFLGGILGMTATVGMLYEDLPVRLCNAYLLDDQVNLGRSLTAGASAIGIVWLLYAGRILMQRDAEREARAAASSPGGE